jgi:hypothetical protein
MNQHYLGAKQQLHIVEQVSQLCFDLTSVKYEIEYLQIGIKATRHLVFDLARAHEDALSLENVTLHRSPSSSCESLDACNIELLVNTIISTFVISKRDATPSTVVDVEGCSY